MRWNIGARLSVLVVACSFGAIILAAILVFQQRSTLYEQRGSELKHITQTVISILKVNHDAATSGLMTEDEAKTRAADTIRQLRYSGSEYFWVNDYNAKVVLHGVKPELEGKDLTDMVDVNGKRIFSEFVAIVKANGSGLVDYYWPKAGSDVPVAKISYVEGFQPWQWIVGTGVYVDDLEAIFWNQVYTLLMLALPVVIVLGFAARLLVRSITKPLGHLSAVMDDLREGRTDMEIAEIGRTDEIGEMARAVDVFRTNAIAQARLEDEQAAGLVAREERQQRIESLIDAFRSTSQDLLGAVDTTNTSLEATARALDSVASSSATQAQDAAGASEEASDNVQSVASAAEELASSISEISQQVSRTTAIVNQATHAAQSSNEKVASLATAASKIGDVVSLIQAIAEQTNLLALNATIEAARAGEMGKGFAVVAAEVKELATQTSKATEEIGTQISAIQSSTAQAVDAIGGITKTMDDVNEYTGAIAAAVEEQGAATNEISRNIQSAASRTQTVVGSISELDKAVKETNRSAESVLTATADASENTQRFREEIATFLRDVAAA
ncbi:cache domain-containing protein [Breoghania sp. L-A4]|uniref:methyl-accepting chemotaxis protein n=1 Tax=Breoghania sp. L-A4 TaxID=2304600 RepID=UPI000E35FE75|nr:cache domain-containing protein [Breoghania sp. L-A4]AXS39202.1 methyl-accepting chemotaxis protein [Breoghania sp. L-A4]